MGSAASLKEDPVGFKPKRRPKKRKRSEIGSTAEKQAGAVVAIDYSHNGMAGGANAAESSLQTQQTRKKARAERKDSLDGEQSSESATAGGTKPRSGGSSLAEGDRSAGSDPYKRRKEFLAF